MFSRMASRWGRTLGASAIEGGVDVDEVWRLSRDEFAAFFEDLERRDVLAGGVAGREVVADVGQAEGTEDGIGDGVAEHVGIGVAVEAVGVRDFDAAEDQRAVFRELVDVVADAGHRDHGIVEVGRLCRMRLVQPGSEDFSIGILPLVATIDQTSGVAGDGGEFDLSAGGFDEEFAGGDVPEGDAGFDVGIEPAAGDVGHGRGRRSPSCASCGPASEARRKRSRPVRRASSSLPQPTKRIDSSRFVAVASRRSGVPLSRGGPPFSTVQVSPTIGSWMTPRTSSPSIAQGDRDAEVGDAVEEVHGAVDRDRRSTGGRGPGCRRCLPRRRGRRPG